MGTMLILIGLFDLGFGSVMTATSIELGRLAGDIESNSTLISLGHGLSQISGGLLNIGSAAEGAIVKSLLGELPPIWITMLLAIGRLILSLAAICLGIALAKRIRRAIQPLARWSIMAFVWGFISMLCSIGLYRFIGDTAGGFASFILVMIDLGVHILWPAAVFYRLRTV